uniref:Uncharacterized protein n=1 Tax=Clytia hemisphaerica TaxID=252671 RepID=A0A7M5X475_9CNID
MKKNYTMYMTFNEEVEVKYLQDINARQDRKTNRFALGWMFIDTSLQSTSNSKESSSTDGASVGGIIFFCIVACFFLQGCYRRNGEGGGCTVPTCPQRATRSQPRSQLCSRNFAIETRRSSVGNQDQTNTRRSSIGDQEQAATPRLRSRTLSNSSRRHSFALEMPTPGIMEIGDAMGIDNIGMEMPTRNDPFDSPPLYNNVMALPSAPTYNDVTLGPSPPIEAPPPSYDEALNMVR